VVIVRNGLAASGSWTDAKGTSGTLEEVTVVAPGMATSGCRARPEPVDDDDALQQNARELRHSRSAGALGLRAWRRLAGLRVAIIGVGRIGSEIA
jgi:hypothetical protein